MIYEFDGFRADLTNKSLSKDGEAVSVTPKVFDTLVVLLEYSPNLVETDRLISLIWQDSFVEKGNLAFNIKMLRKALGDDAAMPRFVENVPRRGYRFIGKVTKIGTEQESADSPESVNRRSSGDQPRSTPANDGTVLRFAIGVISGLVLISLILGFYYRGTSGSKGNSFAQTALTNLNITQPTFAAAISPDGRYLVQAFESDGNHAVSVRQIGQERDIPILSPTDEPIRWLTVSPDNQSVFITQETSDQTESRLIQIPMLGGTPRIILNDIASGISFSPDGRRIAFLRVNPTNLTTELVTADADGLNQKPIAERKYPERFINESGPPVWNSETSLLVISGSYLPDSENDILAVDILSGVAKPHLKIGWKGIRQIVKMSTSETLFVAAFDEETGSDQIFRVNERTGQFAEITNGIGDHSSLSMSDDENNLVAVQSNKSTEIMISPEPNGKNAAPVLSENGNVAGDEGIAWTNDGKLIAAFGPHQFDNIQIIDDSSVTQVTNDTSGNRQPAVCGDQIVYSSGFASPAPKIVRLFAKTPGATEAIAIGPADKQPRLFPTCRDGGPIFYQRGVDNAEIWKIARDGGEPVQVTNYPSFQPTVSPDGKLLAFFSFVDRKWSIDIVSTIDGSLVKRLSVSQKHSIRHLRWTTDGRAVAFSTIQNGTSNLWSQKLDGGEPERITDFGSGQILFFDWSRDGRKLAFAKTEKAASIIVIKPAG